MTSVFYHLETNTWSHDTKIESRCFIGFNQLPIDQIPLKGDSTRFIKFNVKKNGSRLGPIVGILTNEDRLPFSGNIKTFKRICKRVLLNGGIPVILTPSTFSANSIKCYTFCFETKKWIELYAPLPDVIYNRIPSVQYESNKIYKDFRDKICELNIPFFNESYLSKIQTSMILSSNTFLKSHMPETINIKSEKDLSFYLKKYKFLYIKKHNSSRGFGVFKLTLKDNNLVKIRNAFHVELIKSINECWKFLSSLNEEYICQQGILSQLPDGRKFDLRILAHKKEKDYILSGVGVRVGTFNAITTHVPRGGSIITIEELPIDLNYSILKEIVRQTGIALNMKDANFYEFSMDIGIQNNHYYIFEINSKPMVFDETQIKEQGLENLINLFYELSNFTP
ncbi:YheC/YheD family protein [Gottfriedia luciferensis]|uniref:YheC/YheD family protein n=1 Tax=Gottfriedia luciferensis TaxID=178774 RepID=UPI000B43FF98|nr:YheC/YheD family protein [Gottfriedia luciferensis]